jgi:hypothetical protein
VAGRGRYFIAKIAGWKQGVIKMTATAYERGTALRRWRSTARGTAFFLAMLAGGMAGWGAAAQTSAGNLVITCSNPASGASWQISIDFERQTVDSYAATISDSTIAWRDPRDLGSYTLDRKSGNLTVVIASSTGGYFIHDQCKLDK